MNVLGFYTRKKRGDTVIVEWKGEVVALDRERLEFAVGCGSPIWIDKGDLLPSVYPGYIQPKQVEIPAETLAAVKQNWEQNKQRERRAAMKRKALAGFDSHSSGR